METTSKAHQELCSHNIDNIYFRCYDCDPAGEGEKQCVCRPEYCRHTWCIHGVDVAHRRCKSCQPYTRADHNCTHLSDTPGVTAYPCHFCEPKEYARFEEAWLRRCQKESLEDAHVVTLENGEQFLCPSLDAAEDTAEARGGIIDPATVYLRHSEQELAGQYRWRPKSYGAWLDWKYMDDEDEGVAETLSPDVDYSFGADEFLEEELEPRDPLIQADGANLLYRKSINEIVAFRGIGKSLYKDQLIKIATQGGRWLRYSSPGGYRVLLVDGELPTEQLQERIRQQIGDTKGLLRVISPERLPGHTLPALSTLSAQDWLFSQIDKVRPDIIVFDTLTACFRFDTNDADNWLNVNQFLIRLRMMGQCVLITHHPGKSGSQRGRTDAEDNADLVVKLNAPDGWMPGDGAHFKVIYDKVRAGDRLAPFEAKLEPLKYPSIGFRWIEHEDENVAKAKSMLVAGKSLREIAEATGIPKSTISRIGQRMRTIPRAK
jgi:hypothetical protein